MEYGDLAVESYSGNAMASTHMTNEMFLCLSDERGANVHIVEQFLRRKGRNSLNTYNTYKTSILQFYGEFYEHVKNLKDEAGNPSKMAQYVQSFSGRCAALTDISEITTGDLSLVNIIIAELYVSYLFNIKGYKGATIHNKISALSELYNSLLKFNTISEEFKLIQTNPFTLLKDDMPKKVKNPTDYLADEEMRKLLKSINTEDLAGLRDKTLLALLFTTAIRKSEAINIKIGDVSTKGEFTIVKIIQKGSKYHIAKIRPDLKVLMDEYLRRTGRSYENNADEYFFIGHSNNSGKKLSRNSINKMLEKRCKLAGVKKIKVHGTRSSSITSALRNGADLIDVQQNLANHSNVNTTLGYNHLQKSLRNNPSDKIDILK